MAKHETQFQNAPPFCVLEKDDSLLATLSAEEKSYFEPVAVRQTKDVWLRFKGEIMPGLKIADSAYINQHWGKHPAYTFDVDNLKCPFEKPVLVIMGKQDSIVGYSDSWNFLKNYPRASFVVLDNAGHNLQIEQPELFDCLTKEWLERVIHWEKKGSHGA